MSFGPLIDGLSAAIVFGGTTLATVLRVGPRELSVTARALAGLGKTPFSAAQAKADLAAQVSAIRRDGVLRAAPRAIGDDEFDAATDAMIRSRSLDGLIERHHAFRKQRMGEANVAVRTLAQAAELGPVFGMVGTLVSLSTLPGDGLDGAALNSAISMAVVTTLYGLLFANLLLAPLARMVERHAQAEEQGRQEVIDWLSTQLEPVMPKRSASLDVLLSPATKRERAHA
ncbi:MAG: hypothetical protein RIS85_2011 [Pseudomonadota bacterium]|jgi:chemotaxis protein MotA